MLPGPLRKPHRGIWHCPWVASGILTSSLCIEMLKVTKWTKWGHRSAARRHLCLSCSSEPLRGAIQQATDHGVPKQGCWREWRVGWAAAPRQREQCEQRQRRGGGGVQGRCLLGKERRSQVITGCYAEATQS